MLVCGGVSPHPAIIIPEIGRDELVEVKKTVAAMKKWASYIADMDPEVLFFISPHGVFAHSQMAYLQDGNLTGDLAAFGAPDISFNLKNDLNLAQQAAAEANKLGIDTVGASLDYWYAYRPGSLDHGITVPLYYLQKAGVKAEMVAFGISLHPLDKLYRFGQALGKLLDQYPRRVCLIASGDLSHRLHPGAPAGYSPRGKEFDQKIQESLEKLDADLLLKLPDDLIEDAWECGLRPIVMLLGAVSHFTANSHIYSYEGPFGVGYLVAGIGIGERKKEKEGESKEEPIQVQLAKESLKYYLTTGKIMPVPSPVPKGLEKRAGVFVSLKKRGELRGCIGTVEPYRENMAEEIIHNAVAAGVDDPRFWPVELEELPEIEFSVDVLTEPEPVASKDDLDPKRYGVIVKSRGRTGLLLPDLEGVNSVDEQINIACRKAGISPGEPVKLYRFEVIRYKEGR
ncbi:MAG TPA: AmmeMemoRadiSam system protein A [Syntrophaceticus sp.]|nr:AmmeMemoRadiSam system protein A [Syntrophaceticus sp.]